MKNDNLLRNIRAVLVDIDGTLLSGGHALPGLAAFFSFLRVKKIEFILATNNSTEPARRYQERLGAYGVEIGEEKILTTSLATAQYLKNNLEPGASLYVLGEPGLLQALVEAGFRILTDSSQKVAAVLVGGDTHLTYDKLKHATLSIRRGAIFIGTNPDVLIPTKDGLAPECGATLAALKAATDVTPIVVGKPNRYFFELGVQRVHSSLKDTAMIGDRLETDIAGGQAAGLKGILITTGIDNEATIPQKGIFPDLVANDLIDLMQMWEEAIA